MNWGKLFTPTEEKPMNIYESSLYDEWLDLICNKEKSKDVYRSYRDRLCEFVREQGKRTVDTETAEAFLTMHTLKSGAKQGNARWSIFKRYNDWLMRTGRLTVNPWETVDLAKCGCDAEAVSEYTNAQRTKKSSAPKAEAGAEPRFTLSEVALLLIAIEDNDEDAITDILTK